MEKIELKPASVFHYFEEICKVPRPSKKEEKIIAYLMKFAEEQGLEAKKDEAGNILMKKPATPGKENLKTVILQSHIDMVCEKNSDSTHDFLNDPIETYIDGEWLKAKGTTLGADNGIGMAAQLAVLAANDIEHGPIECLFTVDEETGLTGAFALKEGFMDGDILINLDSEDEGEIFIGCAGGIDTTVDLTFGKDCVEKDTTAFIIKVSGLKGGHSGDDINKGLGCANKIITRILWRATDELGLRIAKIDGGNLRNAIAREAYAIITIPSKNAETWKSNVEAFEKAVQYEFRTTEPNLKVTTECTDMPAYLMDCKTQANLLNALYACAHGVLAMSREIPNFVETSTNLASVKMDDEKIYITTSQRSSVESAKRAAAEKIEATFRLIGAHVTHGDGYPGWTPNPDSKILKTAVDAYQRLFGKQPIVRAIHAGLECGLIGEKYEGMDMISYGPTLRGVHSPDERVEIKTVEMFWQHTLEILKSIQ